MAIVNANYSQRTIQRVGLLRGRDRGGSPAPQPKEVSDAASFAVHIASVDFGYVCLHSAAKGDQQQHRDELVLIHAGSFTMGSPEGESVPAKQPESAPTK